MMTFWMISALMLAVAMLFVVVPLWRGKAIKNSVPRDVANLDIYRDQLAEMEADLNNGLLTQEMYDQGKQELQSRLLVEVEHQENSVVVVASNPFKLLAVILIVLTPLTSIGIYWKVGNRQALTEIGNIRSPQGFGASDLQGVLKTLNDKVASNPNDAESWLMLARAYSEMELFPDAVHAYDVLTKLVPDEAQLWADYADVLAMVSGKTLVGKPTQLLDKALILDPNNFKALALSGSAAMERGDFEATIRYWEKLKKLIPQDDENARMVEAGIQHARAFLAQKGGVNLPKQNTQTVKKANTDAAGKEGITGTVMLSAALKGKVNPEDTLFVLARAAQGPKMPLAIIRKQVKDLPLKFTLDDSTSMSPQMKVSNFEQVVIIARISKSGNAMTQPGDLLGLSETISPGTKGLSININQVTP